MIKHLNSLKLILLNIFFLLAYPFYHQKRISNLKIFDFILLIILINMFSVLIINSQGLFILTMVIIIINILVHGYIFLKGRNTYQLPLKPIILVKDGIININHMLKYQYNINSLLLNIRKAGINSLNNVKYIILNNNKKIDIILKNNDY